MNVVMPGIIGSIVARRSVPQEILDQLATMLPMSRLKQPNELGDATLYSASPAPTYVTAQSIASDGGMSDAMLTKHMAKTASWSIFIVNSG
jgi:meso-butanediol dehydrogenase / (S,S)-butanediol dehydrogenase / diacetyl reductase